MSQKCESSNFYLSLAKIVRDAGEEGIAPKQLFVKIVALLTPTGVEVEPYKTQPNIPRFQTIIRFMTLRIVKAGWLVKSNSRWYITNEGVAAIETYSTAFDFGNAAIRAYNSWKIAEPSIESGESDLSIDSVAVTESTPDLTIVTLDSAKETAIEAIRLHLESLKEYEFQDMIAALLRAMGYHVAWVAPPGPDGGIDMVVYSDPLGTQKPRIKVQVKHGSQPSSRVVLDQFFGVLGLDEVGIFVSRGGFTKDAWHTARHDKIRLVTLIDADSLVELWIKYYSQMSEDQKAFMRIEPVYFLATS